MAYEFPEMHETPRSWQWKNAWGHFRTITRHKLMVMKNCFKVGLYRQGLTHDLSKYSPTEFCIGVRYYQGDKSPNAAERWDKGHSEAWMHHKGRNKHHFEYWIDLPQDPSKGMEGKPMPARYVAEMVCDRIAASKIYKGSSYTNATSLEYFQLESSSEAFLMHPDTKHQLEFLLTMVAEHGEEETFRYIRTELLGR